MATRDNLDWDDLRYFLRAAQAKTLAGAARAMGVEHTTIGRRISALERALGAPLVIRRSDGLQLTPLGASVAALTEDVARAVGAVQELVATHRSRVRVAVPTGVSRLIAPHLARLRSEHPEITIELLSASGVVDLAKGEADLAVRVGPITDPDLTARKLADVGMSLYAAEAYLARHSGPCDPLDLAGHDVIAYDGSRVAFPPAQWLEEHAAGATIVLRCREMSEMITAAVGGAGIALLACWLAEDEPVLRRLTREVLVVRPLSLVYRREALVAAPVRVAAKFLTRVMHDAADALRGEVQRVSAGCGPRAITE